MLSEIIKHLESIDSLYDFGDAVVVARLKMTRELYLEEIERLGNLDELSDVQQQDYQELLEDIIAIDRVLGFYGWTEDEDVHSRD